ncbi:MAG: type IV secretory system conjugative DNA transfer family protein [Alphaproteobacteria bacterium]|nr:type IV secretory system conjugative DNA transfer family protein [Alphaproteobacteria bacterium]
MMATGIRLPRRETRLPGGIGFAGIRRIPARVALAAALLLAAVMPARAAPGVVAGTGPLTSLQALKEIEAPESGGGEEERAAKRRGEAQRLAALAWASQAGLAHRGREIAALLEKRAKALSAVFDFRALMLDRGGFLVMPPVLAETRDAIRIEPGRAASARRVLRIAAGERIVGAPPVWRDWLEREWEAARPPASVLFPRNDEERRRWDGWLEEGWRHGVRLADDIHASDLERLVSAFEGMVRWHRLREAAMVSAPGTRTEVTAVSGHERLLRISETVVRLDGRSAFNLAPREWRPLPAPAEGDDSGRARP